MSAPGKMCWLADVPIQPLKSRKEGHSSAADKTASHVPKFPSLLIARIPPSSTRQCPQSTRSTSIQPAGLNGNGTSNTSATSGLVSVPKVGISIPYLDQSVTVSGEWEYEYEQPQAGDEQIPRELGDLPASINDQNQQYEEQTSDNYRHDSAVNELTQTLSAAELDDPRDRGKGRSQSRGSGTELSTVYLFHLSRHVF